MEGTQQSGGHPLRGGLGTGVLAVAIGTPPTRGVVRGRSTPPGLDAAEDAGSATAVKRRGVTFPDGDPKIREVYEYILDHVNRLESRLDARIDAVSLQAARRSDELATSCAKRTEVVDRFSELQQCVDHMRGGAKTDLEDRLAQADKNVTDVLQKHQEMLKKLAEDEAIIKAVTESNFSAMHNAGG